MGNKNDPFLLMIPIRNIKYSKSMLDSDCMLGFHCHQTHSHYDFLKLSHSVTMWCKSSSQNDHLQRGLSHRHSKGLTLSPAGLHP